MVTRNDAQEAVYTLLQYLESDPDREGLRIHLSESLTRGKKFCSIQIKR